MPDPTPIPSASALARAVEASERNRREEVDRGWRAGFEALHAAVAESLSGDALWLLNNKAHLVLVEHDRALRRDTPDVG